MAVQMQFEANADTSAEEESFGPQLISRLEVGKELALEKVIKKSAVVFLLKHELYLKIGLLNSYLCSAKKSKPKHKPQHVSSSAWCYVALLRTLS